MKLYNILYKSAVALTMATSAMLVSCNQEPEPISTEETYLRNFIKMYGLIDPEQDWNMAATSSLTLIGDDVARDVNVLVRCGGTLRRVAEYRSVKGNTKISNLDIPSFATALYVESNGEIMMADLNGEVSLSEFSVPDNNSSPSYAAGAQYENLGWIIAGEDLGATDDMDFNDIVFRIESVAVNYKGTLGSSDWQVVDDDEWVDITKDNSQPASAKSRADGDEMDKVHSKRIRITALASGGTLPLYLHYRSPDNDNADFIFGIDVNGSRKVLANSIGEEAAKSLEWHRWFGCDRDDVMLNTGTPAGGLTLPTANMDAVGVATVYVDESFTMEKYSYVDYDQDNSFEVKESWEWTDFKYVKSNIQAFYITVGGHLLENCQTALYAANKGAAPMLFLIPDCGPDGTLWHWPVERTKISDVYPQFTDWVNSVTNFDWFETYAANIEKDKHYMRK